MIRATRLALAAAVSTAALAVAADGAAGAGPGDGASSSPPAHTLDLAVEEVRLENGLTLLLLEDHEAPVFTIMLFVPAGGRTEPPGKTGISHYLEHCYSLGSSKLAPREIDRLVQSLGGQKNASTSRDYTAFYESLPAAALERIIEAEADRLATLALPADRLASELDVVREERRWRYENSPSGIILEKLLATAFERHPYRNPVIGWPEDLRRISRDDALAYYRRHYAPANATFVLVGDFDPERAKALFRRHFGPLPGGERPRIEVPQEPEQTSERRETIRRESVKLPRLAMLWKVPPLDHPDTYPLRVLETILFDGDAARLERILRRERKLVTSVSGGLWETRDSGPFVLEAEALEGVPIDEVERACDEAIAAVGEETIGSEELARAKSGMEVSFLTGLESTVSRARTIGRYHVTSARGAGYLGDYVERTRAVAAGDVRRVAATYLTPARRTVVHLLPGSDAPAPATAAAAAIVGEPWGEARRFRLANGLTVLYQRVERLPTVALAANVRAGAAVEPRAKAGLSTATVELLKAGTPSLDEEALAESFAALGSSLSVSRGADAVGLAASLLSRDFERGLDLLAEILRRPSFPEDKVERVRRELLAEKASAAAEPEELLIEAFYRAVYAGEPYELPLNGTPETLAAIEAADVRSFHRAHYRPERVALAIVGAVDPSRVRAALERAFGDWRGETAGTGTESGAGSGRQKAPRIVLVDKPDQTQAHIRLGAPAICRSDPDYDALALAHAVLGGSGLASRIADVVRTRHGLAYAAGTVLVPRALPGAFAAVAQTKSATAGKAVALMLEELERIRREPVPEDELARAKAQVAGSLPFRIETNAQKAAVLLEGDLYGLGPDHLRHQIERIEALTAAEVLAAAEKHIRPAEMTIAVVGARSEIEAQLAPFETREGSGR